MTSSSLLWADGKDKWSSLSEIDELSKYVIINNPKLAKKKELDDTQNAVIVSENAVQNDAAVKLLDGGDGEDDFIRWQEEIRKAEEEAARLKARTGKHGAVAASFVDSRSKNNEIIDGTDIPVSPPKGEEEFTDDDGTTYRWNRARRVWVPEVDHLICHRISVCRRVDIWRS